MDLYKEILLHALMECKCMDRQPDAVVEGVCYRAIRQIRSILDDEALNDFDCIERIVSLLEAMGIDAGARHDFG